MATHIHSTAIIYPNVEIGKEVYIGEYSVVGAPAEIKGIPQQHYGKVVIGNGTVIREHVTIHSPREAIGETKIGENCYIMSHSHIGHDAIIGDNCTLSSGAIVGGHAVLNNHSNMGLNSTIHQRTIMEVGSMLGASSFGKNVIKAWHIVGGVPAKFLKFNNHLRLKLKLQDL